MKKILNSACLIGQDVRYNAKILDFEHSIIEKWKALGVLISVCPEVAGNLPIPRKPAEIQSGIGNTVWQNNAEVMTTSGELVTDQFKIGAEKALDLALKNQITMAILKERSPSCGHREIYNGNFEGTLIAGSGVTTALLEKNGIVVFSEEELEGAYQFWLKGD